MAARANAAVNMCEGTRLRPENIQAAYAGSEENREPLWLTTVEQDASACARTTRGLNTSCRWSVGRGEFPPGFAPAFPGYAFLVVHCSTSRRNSATLNGLER